MFRMKTINIDMFFDSPKVLRAADRATRTSLSKAGAFVRTAARSSIRKRKRVSEPGQPPSSHTGLLRRGIMFGYEASRKTVVIGPRRLGGKIGQAPDALEHGGTSVVVSGLRAKRKKRIVRIAARPFMGPAMAQEAPKFAGLWANSVR